MKKNLWTRLVAAVLTTAMAFSILAVPASAASTGNSWAIGTEELEIMGGDTIYCWYGKEFLRDDLIENWDASLEEEFGEPMPQNVEKALKAYLEMFKAQQGVLVQENVPETAYVGFSKENSPYANVLWFTKADITEIARLEDAYGYANETIYWGTGAFVVEGKVFYAIGYEPVLATDKDFEWAVVAQGEKYIQGMNGYAWVPAKVLVEQMGLDASKMTVDEVNFIKAAAILSGQDVKDVECEDEAFCGISESAERDAKIYWFTEKEIRDLDKAVEDAGADGTATYVLDSEGNLIAKDASGTIIATAKPIQHVADEPSAPQQPTGGSSSSSDGSAVAIVAAAGAAAVAATGVYFYTHPEKWQEIKDYFADLSANVQAKFQEFTDGVKGALGIPTEEAETAETAENAENAAVPQDAAA